MLTDLQVRAARLMAANRPEESYFADGAVLNENTERIPDDLDIFHDDDRSIDALCRKDIRALPDEGLDVFIDIDTWACVEARVYDEWRRGTIIQWVSESRMRYFPLVQDPFWGASGCIVPTSR